MMGCGAFDFKSCENLSRVLGQIAVSMRSQRLPLVLFLLQIISANASCFAAVPPEETREISEVNALSNHAIMIKRLDQYISQHPQAARVIGFRAEVHNVLIHPKETIRDADEYFRLTKPPFLPVIYKVRANAYFHLGQWGKAIPDLECARKLDAKDVVTEQMLASGLEKVGRKKDAIFAYGRAAKLNDVDALVSKAKLELKLDLTAQAEADLIEYSRKSKNANVANTLIFNQYQQRQYKRVLSLCDVLIDAKIADAQTYGLKASALSELGRFPESLQACDIATSMNGDENANVRYSIYSNWKQPEKAIPYLQKMIKATPKNLDLYIARASYEITHANYEEALSDLIRASALVDKQPGLSAQRGECYFRAGKYAEAARDFAFVNKSNATVDTLKFEGRALNALKNYNEAAQCFSKALVTQPLSSTLLAYRGESYFRMNDYARVNKDFSDAITLSPKECSYYYARGTCRLAAGHAKEAVSDFTVALNEPALQSVVYAARAQAYYKLNKKDLAEKDQLASKSASRSIEKDLFK